VVVPYHWDDRAKAERDYHFTLAVFERVLPDLARCLNVLHGLSHSEEFWRLVVGPWLLIFTEVLFDRWAQLQQIPADQPVTTALVSSQGQGTFVPTDMLDFSRHFVSDEWNHSIYSAMIARQGRLPRRALPDIVWPPPLTASAMPPAAIQLGKWLLGILGSHARIEVMSADLPRLWRVRLALSGRATFGTARAADLSSSPYREDRRAWTLPTGGPERFESVLRELIPLQIPRVYLEGFQEVYGPAKARWQDRGAQCCVVTNNLHFTRDVNCSAALAVENGASLVLQQHGGGYGSYRWLGNEDLERSVAHRYLVWGRPDACDGGVVVTGMLKSNPFRKRRRGVRRVRRKKLVLMLGMWPRYSYKLGSEPIAGQVWDYVEDVARFIQALEPHCRASLTVRLPQSDFGWGLREYLLDKAGELAVSDHKEPLSDLAAKARLVVATTNSTALLETAAANRPVMAYWRPTHWELRETARPAFEALEAAGVLHTGPVAAAHAVNRIWSSVETWWRDDLRQEARREFCKLMVAPRVSWPLLLSVLASGRE
jgi:putative transferase (TIGR04331 family)